jgi:hypothetical protein
VKKSSAAHKVIGQNVRHQFDYFMVFMRKRLLFCSISSEESNRVLSVRSPKGLIPLPRLHDIQERTQRRFWQQVKSPHLEERHRQIKRLIGAEFSNDTLKDSRESPQMRQSWVNHITHRGGEKSGAVQNNVASAQVVNSLPRCSESLSYSGQASSQSMISDQSPIASSRISQLITNALIMSDFVKLCMISKAVSGVLSKDPGQNCLSYLRRRQMRADLPAPKRESENPFKRRVAPVLSPGVHERRNNLLDRPLH